jgi:predicted methyltransferase
MGNKKLNKINYNLILDVKTNIPFYKQITFKIIDYIRNNGSASIDEILSFVGGGERRIARLLDQMVNLDMLMFTNSKFSMSNNNKVKFAQGKTQLFNNLANYKDLFVFMNKVIKDRPQSTFIFDQRPVNINTIVSRVAYLIWRGDLQNKKIVLIGDDDLTSIALAWTNIAKEITVFDIDERLLELINNISKQYNLKINVVHKDLLKDLPKKYINHYDTFITDPTPTIKPLTLFTNKGLQMLKQEPGKIGYISLYPSHADINIDYQKTISKMYLLISDLIPFFNQYEIIEKSLIESDINLLKKYKYSNNCISFYEYWMRIQTTKFSKPLKMKISQIDLLGKATKQILKDPSKDPAFNDKYKSEFINTSMHNLIKLAKNKVK